MEILEAPSREWSHKFKCGRCKTKFLADQDDLKFEGFKVSGYHFTGTAVIEDKLFVECPTDGQLSFVKEDDVPVVLRDELVKKLQEMRR